MRHHIKVDIWSKLVDQIMVPFIRSTNLHQLSTFLLSIRLYIFLELFIDWQLTSIGRSNFGSFDVYGDILYKWLSKLI